MSIEEIILNKQLNNNQKQRLQIFKIILKMVINLVNYFLNYNLFRMNILKFIKIQIIKVKIIFNYYKKIKEYIKF